MSSFSAILSHGEPKKSTQAEAFEMIQEIGMGGDYADAMMDKINGGNFDLLTIIRIGYPHLNKREAKKFERDLNAEYMAQVKR